MMRAFAWKKLLFFGMVSVLVLSALATAPSVSANGRVSLTGTQAHFSKSATDLGPSQAGAIDFSVGLRLHNTDQLQQLLIAQRTPGSPDYQQFLTSDAFAQRFAPTASDEHAVVAYLQSYGITVRKTWPNHLLIDATGTPKQIEAAFGSPVHDYQTASGRYYANTTDVQVPVSLANLIGSVIGLDNYVQLNAANDVSNVKSKSSTPSGFSPQQIATAYDLNGAYAAGVNGAGQTIAIATAYTYKASDVQTFWQYYGVTAPTLVEVPVDGRTNKNHVETTIDVERAGSVANGATIRVYEGTNTQLKTFTDVYNQIVVDDIAKVATTSWGLCESSTGNATIQSDDAIFAQAAAEGITFFASSGDHGSSDCGSTPSVEYPASDPYVTAVGGTSLTVANDGSIATESAWSQSGGGSSAFFTSKPTWQAGIGDGNRDLADVAFNADPGTGYAVYYDGIWRAYGGTSFGAPQWAGIIALANQYRGAKGPIGEGNPALYALATHTQSYLPFHDITVGSNGAYSTAVGWDYPTGWGTPDAWNVIRDLANLTN